MGKKRKDISKLKVGDLSPTRKERDNALEEYGSHIGSFDNLFDFDDDDDEDDDGEY